jgi:RNA recognition motif-containing protein
MDNEEIFTTSFPAGRKQIFVDVKENNIGKYLKIKERGDSQNNSIIIPAGSIVQLRNALDEAVQALGALDTGEPGEGGGAPPNQCVCHVSNLSWDTNDDTLHELFSGYGEVVSADVQTSRSGRSQGWGLVEFASAAEVEYAISQCDGLDLDGREIRVRADKGSGTGHAAKEAMLSAMPKKTRRHVADKVVDPHRIFVMNLNFATTEEELADHCASSGEVASVELLTRGRAQRPSGSAVVEYRYAEAAAAAVDALEGTELDGRDLRVRAYFSN